MNVGCWLDVAMHNPAAVQVRHSPQHLPAVLGQSLPAMFSTPAVKHSNLFRKVPSMLHGKRHHKLTVDMCETPQA